MIFNRTSADVASAVNIIENKLKKSLSITEEERQVLELGTINIATLNRIYEAQHDIADKIKNMGYWGASAEPKVWDSSDVFFENDLLHVISTNEQLKTAFFKKDDTPSKPKSEYTISTINAIEKTLSDLYDIIAEVEGLWSFCGEKECGEI